MHVINVHNVAQALPAGLGHLLTHGQRETSRVGDVLVAPTPVVTAYSHPRERVLFSAHRDANPFFHLMESLWMLAGRDDAAFLNNYVKDFGDRFAEPDGNIHDAYGRRWRKNFRFVNNAEAWTHIDQLDWIVGCLKDDPGSRQAVLAMWDPAVGDLDLPKLKTRPCNTHAYFRVRREMTNPHWNSSTADPEYRSSLDMTVCCRSNDIIMGAYGANAVHFSVLQEYLAARLGVGVGTYYQVSNNFHAYVADVERLRMRASGQPSNPNHAVPDMALTHALLDERYYTGTGAVSPGKLVTVPHLFDQELREVVGMMDDRHEAELSRFYQAPWGRVFTIKNTVLVDTAWRAAFAMRLWRIGLRVEALQKAEEIEATDWRVACTEWVMRRMK